MQQSLDIRIDREGRVFFAIPLPTTVVRKYKNLAVDVVYDCFRFCVDVDDEIALPLASRSFDDARSAVSVVANQVVVRLLELERNAQGVTIAARDVRLVSPANLDMMPADGIVTKARGDAGCADPQTLTFAELFEAWALQHVQTGGAPTTPPYWRVLVQRFVVFLGHDRPQDVTAHDIRAYRDHLIATGRRLRTARHSDFAALRALFQFAVENEVVTGNPTSGIRFKPERLAATQAMKAFSPAQARGILAAADKETLAARRWIPWLTALTGSRVAAIANLRKQDVVEVEGIWCLRISRQAGPIKTAASERLVPIHSAILARGFLSFVDTTDRERLFIDKPLVGSRLQPMIAAETGPPVYHPGRSTLRRLTDWLHGLDLGIGRDAKIDPNHAWRHWFKEQAFAAAVPEKITDAIVGHAQATTSRRYGSVSLAMMAEALEQIRPPV